MLSIIQMIILSVQHQFKYTFSKQYREKYKAERAKARQDALTRNQNSIKQTATVWEDSLNRMEKTERAAVTTQNPVITNDGLDALLIAISQIQPGDLNSHECQKSNGQKYESDDAKHTIFHSSKPVQEYDSDRIIKETFSQPTYEAPAYQEPKYDAPTYESPKYESPSYEPSTDYGSSGSSYDSGSSNSYDSGSSGSSSYSD